MTKAGLMSDVQLDYLDEVIGTTEEQILTCLDYL